MRAVIRPAGQGELAGLVLAVMAVLLSACRPGMAAPVATVTSVPAVATPTHHGYDSTGVAKAVHHSYPCFNAVGLPNGSSAKLSHPACRYAHAHPGTDRTASQPIAHLGSHGAITLTA